MRKINTFLFLIISILFISCSPKVTTTLLKQSAPLDYKENVVVIGLDDSVPEKADTLGKIKIGDTGFTTDCAFEVVIEEAIMEARKSGGNAIKITKHKPPTALGSTCHRIEALILRIDSTDIVLYDKQEVKDTVLLGSIDHAKLYVYRHGGTGALINYDLYLNDDNICVVSNKFKQEFPIYKHGERAILWAKTEAKSEVAITFEAGKSYYLRCSVKMGILVGRPYLELVDEKTGKLEYESLKTKQR
jgi:hypothetical protein